MSVPKLRFNEFSSLWGKKKVQHLIDAIDSGWSPLCEVRSADIDEWGVLKTTAVTWDGFSDVENKKLPTKLLPRPQLEVRPGDILITRAGPVERVGVVCHVDKTRSKLMLSDKLIRLKSNESTSSNFLAKVFGAKNIQVQLESLKSGLAAAQTNISQSGILNIEVSLPVLAEQTKIANFLTTVDEKISQITRKLELLTQYKKGVMQQIFSQELRFKDDDGQEFPEWEETNIGKVLKIGSGKDYKHLSAGDVPVYGTGGYMLSVNDYLYEGESVCIGRKGTIDKPTLLTGRFWTVDTLFYTHSFLNCIPRFIYACFQMIDWKGYNEASGVPSLSKSTIEKIDIKIPVLAEQTKISNFITALDDKISAAKTELKAVKQYKQGLIQQMFV